MDEYLRQLERQARSGDPEARQKLLRWQEKLKGPEPKYFRYRQNNIAGYFHNDPTKGIGPDVAVEAYDEEHADERLQSILGNSYYGYCECCGRRWKNAADIFEDRNRLSSWWFHNTGRYGRDACYLHLLDGTIVSC